MTNSRLERSLGYSFKDAALLDLALSHRSVGKLNNERLEFLGDSLLNFIVGEALFDKFPAAREGDLTRVRASLVKGDTLAEVAKEFSLGDYLNLGEGELKSGGFRRASILADAVEAIIGAIYRESGMDECRRSVLRWYQSRLDATCIETTGKDPKTRLQEYQQQRKRPLPIYHVISSCGDSHDLEFVVECDLGGRPKSTQARAGSKRAAEKLAAQAMLEQLETAYD